MNRTLRRTGSFAVLLIELEDDVATTCTAVFRAGGLTVTRAAHVAAACERIPVLQPKLVVVPAALEGHAREPIEDRAVAVGAEVVWLDSQMNREQLTTHLAKIVEATLARAQRAESER